MSKLIISFPTMDIVIFRNTSRTCISFTNVSDNEQKQQPTRTLFAFTCTLLQGISSTYTHIEYVALLSYRKYFLFSLFVSSGDEVTASVSYPQLRTVTFPATITTTLTRRLDSGASRPMHTRKNTLEFSNTYLFP